MNKDEAGGGGGKSTSDAFTFEELRAIFTLHTGTVSQTHDVLGCSCHLRAVGYDNGDNTTMTTTPEDILPGLQDTFVSAAKVGTDSAPKVRHIWPGFLSFRMVESNGRDHSRQTSRIVRSSPVP
jgi:hypothetical protein